MPTKDDVRWFSDIRVSDVALVGGKRNGRHVGICGEAPANYPEIARYLTQLGIDSISANPSSILRTMQVVSDAEGSIQTQARMQGRFTLHNLSSSLTAADAKFTTRLIERYQSHTLNR